MKTYHNTVLYVLTLVLVRVVLGNDKFEICITIGVILMTLGLFGQILLNGTNSTNNKNKERKD